MERYIKSGLLWLNQVWPLVSAIGPCFCESNDQGSDVLPVKCLDIMCREHIKRGYLCNCYTFYLAQFHFGVHKWFGH